MTEEQFVKKLVELAEGFEWVEILVGTNKLYKISYRKSYVLIQNIRKWEHYPLLLYRAITEINWQSEKWNIIIDSSEITIGQGEQFYKVIKFRDYDKTSYLTAQEQALEAALSEVL